MAVRTAAWGATFRDARGQVARAGAYYHFTTPGGDAAALTAVVNAVNAMGALSNALVFGGYGLNANVQAPNQYGGTGAYQNAEDKAVFTFLSADNTLHRVSVPAPKLAIFLADGETVDLTNTDVVAFTSAMQTADGSGGFVSNKAGSALIACPAAARARRRFQRKVTIWTLTPDETGPEE